jgi:hypothetical protein
VALALHWLPKVGECGISVDSILFYILCRNRDTTLLRSMLRASPPPPPEHCGRCC